MDTNSRFPSEPPSITATGQSQSATFLGGCIGCLGLLLLAAIAAIVAGTWNSTSDSAPRTSSSPEASESANTNAAKSQPPKFKHIFKSEKEYSIGGIEITTLDEMIEAVYRGSITVEEASRYAFAQSSFGGGGFSHVAGEHLIFFANPRYGVTREFALPRDPAIEALQAQKPGGLEEYYDSLRFEKGLAYTSSPLNSLDGVRISGRMEFATNSGLLKLVPVVETVSLPSP